MEGLGMGTGTERKIPKPRNTSSISFDGSDDFLSIPVNAYSGGSGVSDFSFSIWVRFPSGGATPFRRKSMFDIYDDTSNYWKFSFAATNKEVFQVYIGGAFIINYASDEAIDAGLADTFVHYVISHDRSSGTTVYKNGVALTAATNTVADTTTNIHIAEPLRIGVYGTAYAEFMCNEFASFIGTALSAAQVKALYNKSTPHVKGSEGVARNGLRGLYLMGDGTEAGSGTTVYDMQNSTGDATLTNGAAYSTTVR
jgi:hypothetical protein